MEVDGAPVFTVARPAGRFMLGRRPSRARRLAALLAVSEMAAQRDRRARPVLPARLALAACCFSLVLLWFCRSSVPAGAGGPPAALASWLALALAAGVLVWAASHLVLLVVRGARAVARIAGLPGRMAAAARGLATLELLLKQWLTREQILSLFTHPGLRGEVLRLDAMPPAQVIQVLVDRAGLLEILPASSWPELAALQAGPWVLAQLFQRALQAGTLSTPSALLGALAPGGRWSRAQLRLVALALADLPVPELARCLEAAHDLQTVNDAAAGLLAGIVVEAQSMEPWRVRNFEAGLLAAPLAVCEAVAGLAGET